MHASSFSLADVIPNRREAAVRNLLFVLLPVHQGSQRTSAEHAAFFSGFCSQRSPRPSSAIPVFKILPHQTSGKFAPLIFRKLPAQGTFIAH